MLRENLLVECAKKGKEAFLTAGVTMAGNLDIERNFGIVVADHCEALVAAAVRPNILVFGSELQDAYKTRLAFSLLCAVSETVC